MYLDSTPDPLLEPLRRALSRPRWQNLLLLILAVQLARTLVQRQLSLFLLCSTFSTSCYRRLSRLLAWKDPLDPRAVSEPAAAPQPLSGPALDPAGGPGFQRLHRLWVRAVVACFAPGRGTLVLLIDWTAHTDRCQSLSVMLPVGGRAVPLAFWLSPTKLGGKGAQRRFEDAALTQLAQWLGRRRPVVFIGDRGFRGFDRMQFLKKLGWHFVLRVTQDTKVRLTPGDPWQTLASLEPEVGRRWQNEVGYGKDEQRERLRVNLVALRAALPTPKKRLTNKGKPTGEWLTETTWYLATDLSLTIDVVALYRLRMQIEQSFRDSKALLGLEREKTRQPEVRLRLLLWAVMIGIALDLRRAEPQPLHPRRLPRARRNREVVPPLTKPTYPAESATRAGLHALVVEVVLGHGALWEELAAIQRKSERMQARPQVRERRRTTPALRNRRRTQPVTPTP